MKKREVELQNEKLQELIKHMRARKAKFFFLKLFKNSGLYFLLYILLGLPTFLNETFV